MPAEPLNSLADALPAMAVQFPDQAAIRCPGPGCNNEGFASYGSALTFAELNAKADLAP